MGLGGATATTDTLRVSGEFLLFTVRVSRNKTDAGYLKKIRSDLDKAIALKRDGKYEIDSWTFVTPRKLSDDVISQMRKLGKEFGISTHHQESTYLANELYRRSHLLKGFPELQAVDLEKKIEDLREILKLQELEKSDGGSKAVASVFSERIIDEAGHSHLKEILSGRPTPEGKTRSGLLPTERPIRFSR